MGAAPPFPENRYRVIYADPPWNFVGMNKLNARTSGKELADHYATMGDWELMALPVASLAERNCLLFLWTAHSKLPVALDLVRAWGFRYSTVAFEWFKRTSTGRPVCFMGRWVCGGAIELCLLGRRGSVPRISKRVRRLVDAPRREHSRKPDEVRRRIVELVGDVPRIELFAREQSDGWDAWGNEVPPSKAKRT
jgi:site-specific DNA-methyltransferase (adenine-specific)